MGDQEKELLEGYRQLRPESKRLIMSTVVTAFTDETVIRRQYGLPPENSPVQAIRPHVSGKGGA